MWMRLLAAAAVTLFGTAACQDRPSHGTKSTPAQLRRPGSPPGAEPTTGDAAGVASLFAGVPRFGTPDGLPRTPSSFPSAKRQAFGIYADHLTTFYCGCTFNSDQAVAWDSCGYAVRSNERRAGRIEWEHVVPAHAFGHHRACWKEQLCEKPGSGKKYRGRKCCGRQDPQFRKMEADLVNLVPAVGEVNADRSNYPFGEVAGEPREYGQCDIEVDRTHQVTEPPPAVRGDIARAYLYMHYVYGDGLPLTAAEVRRFEQWHQADPPTAWERTRNQRIAQLQGAGNPLVK